MGWVQVPHPPMVSPVGSSSAPALAMSSVVTCPRPVLESKTRLFSPIMIGGGGYFILDSSKHGIMEAQNVSRTATLFNVSHVKTF